MDYQDNDAAGYTDFLDDVGNLQFRIQSDHPAAQALRSQSRQTPVEGSLSVSPGQGADHVAMASTMRDQSAAPALQFYETQQQQLGEDMLSQPQDQPTQDPSMLGGAGLYQQQAGMGPMPRFGISPTQQQGLDLRDVDAATVAAHRDEREELMQHGSAALDRQTDDLAYERRRADANRDEARNYMLEKRAQLDDAQQTVRGLISQGINPNRIFENGTVGRTQAILAGMAGGVFKGPGGENTSIKLLNQMIDRDVEAQRTKLEAAGQQANNLLATYNSAFDDSAMAETAYRTSMLDYMQSEMQAIANRIDSVQARENSNRTIVAIQQEKNQLQQQFEAQAAAARAAEMARRQQLAMWGEDAAWMANISDQDRKDAMKIADQIADAEGLTEDVDKEIARLEAEMAETGGLKGIGPIEGRVAPDVAYSVAAGMGADWGKRGEQARRAQNRFQATLLNYIQKGNPSDAERESMRMFLQYHKQSEETAVETLKMMRSALGNSNKTRRAGNRIASRLVDHNKRRLYGDPSRLRMER